MLLIWWHQDTRLAQVTDTEIVTAQVGPQALVDVVKPPKLSANEDWLQASLRDVFDHYLLDYYEQPTLMWQVFNQYCQAQVSCPEIAALFRRYIEYKEALLAFDKGEGSTLFQIEQQLDGIALAQADYFSKQEIDVLFANEELWHRSALERMAIMQDKRLTAVERSELLNQHYQKLNPEHTKTIAPTLALKHVTQLGEQGRLSSNDYNQLAAEFGHQTAERLVIVEEKRLQWQNKLSLYQDKVAFLKDKYQEQPAYYQEELSELQLTLFSANELKRVKVLLAE